MGSKLLCGIDEAGRGPLAGPLVIAGVILDQPVEGLMDSKKLSQKQRESLYPRIITASQYHIAIFSHEDIDNKGISECLRDGLEQIKGALEGTRYLYDGNATYGVEEIETMVKADMKVPQVSAASILAKVTRDRIMCEYAIHYPEYGFEGHKGYGTRAHVDAIGQYGKCDIHRQSFRIRALERPTLF